MPLGYVTPNLFKKPKKTQGAQMDKRRFTKVKNTTYNLRGDIKQNLPDAYVVEYNNGTVGMLYKADEGKTWIPLEVTTNKTKYRWEEMLLSSNPGNFVNFDTMPSEANALTEDEVAEIAQIDADMAAFEAEMGAAMAMNDEFPELPEEII